MSELTIESDGVRLTLAAAKDVDLWPLSKAAFDAACAALHAAPETSSASSICIGSSTTTGSVSERIREIAKDMLSDGRSRERREIAKAVRAAGLTSEGLDQALKRDKRFERDHNVMGRPIWRDTSVPAPLPPPPTPDHVKPEWMRTSKPMTRDEAIAAANGHQ